MYTASFCKLYEPVQLFCGQWKYLPIRPQESDVGRPIYVFNSVVNTKLPAIPSHRRSTTVSLKTYPLYSFFIYLLRWQRCKPPEKT